MGRDKGNRFHQLMAIFFTIHQEVAMFVTKIKLAGLAALVFAVLGALLLHGQTERKGGRLLSEREMGGIFGDVGANNMCGADMRCSCTTTGTYCTKCDDGNGTGGATSWDRCCASTGDDCHEDGNLACGNLFVWRNNAAGYSNRVNCCTPCWPNGQWEVTMDFCNTRSQASGTVCAVGI
jgi:hypothetical protein